MFIASPKLGLGILKKRALDEEVQRTKEFYESRYMAQSQVIAKSVLDISGARQQFDELNCLVFANIRKTQQLERLRSKYLAEIGGKQEGRNKEIKEMEMSKLIKEKELFLEEETQRALQGRLGKLSTSTVIDKQVKSKAKLNKLQRIYDRVTKQLHNIRLANTKASKELASVQVFVIQQKQDLERQKQFRRKQLVSIQELYQVTRQKLDLTITQAAQNNLNIQVTFKQESNNNIRNLIRTARFEIQESEQYKAYLQEKAQTHSENQKLIATLLAAAGITNQTNLTCDESQALILEKYHNYVSSSNSLTNNLMKLSNQELKLRHSKDELAQELQILTKKKMITLDRINEIAKKYKEVYKQLQINTLNQAIIDFEQYEHTVQDQQTNQAEKLIYQLILQLVEIGKSVVTNSHFLLKLSDLPQESFELKHKIMTAEQHFDLQNFGKGEQEKCGLVYDDDELKQEISASMIYEGISNIIIQKFLFTQSQEDLQLGIKYMLLQAHSNFQKKFIDIIQSFLDIILYLQQTTDVHLQLIDEIEQQHGEELLQTANDLMSSHDYIDQFQQIAKGAIYTTMRRLSRRKTLNAQQAYNEYIHKYKNPPIRPSPLDMKNVTQEYSNIAVNSPSRYNLKKRQRFIMKAEAETFLKPEKLQKQKTIKSKSNNSLPNIRSSLITHWEDINDNKRILQEVRGIEKGLMSVRKLEMLAGKSHKIPAFHSPRAIVRQMNKFQSSFPPNLKKYEIQKQNANICQKEKCQTSLHLFYYTLSLRKN